MKPAPINRKDFKNLREATVRLNVRDNHDRDIMRNWNNVLEDEGLGHDGMELEPRELEAYAQMARRLEEVVDYGAATLKIVDNAGAEVVTFAQGDCFTVEAAAASLELSAIMVRKLVREEKLTASRFGKTLIVDGASVRDYAQNRRRSGRPSLSETGN